LLYYWTFVLSLLCIPRICSEKYRYLHLYFASIPKPSLEPTGTMVNLTGYNIAIAAFAALGGYTYAYAYSVFATVIGQPGFYIYFNLDREFSEIIK
jgi:hypothetical protein